MSAGDAVHYYFTDGVFDHNTVTGNLSGSYTFGVDLPTPTNRNNIFDNTATYKVYNHIPSDSPDVDATNNWWGTTDESEIQVGIYDFHDDFRVSIVDYHPYLMSPDTDAPISPPANLTMDAGADSVHLSWSANPEGDVAGYRVYWGTQPGPFFEHVVDVGSSTNHTIVGEVFYIGVTAYDTDYADANDDPETIVNENQTSGHESWYAIPSEPLERPSITVNPDPIDLGNAIVGRQYEATLEIINDGNVDLDVTNITHNLGEDLQVDPIPPYDPPLTVAPGETASVALTLTIGVEGAINGTLSIESNDPTSPTEIDILAVAKILLGDLSGDGTVSAYDASLILRFVVGSITEFPIESMMAGASHSMELRDYVMSIPDVAVRQGEKALVPVVVDDARGTQAGGIVVRYDSRILRAVDVMPTQTLSSSYWESSISRPSEIRFAWASVLPIQTGDRLLVLEFEALPHTAGAVSPLRLDQVALSNSSSVARKHGSITVLPSHFLLSQNCPNPFNAETIIAYDVAKTGAVSLCIYALTGQRVRTLADGEHLAGMYSAIWDGVDDTGQAVASGVYLCRMEAGEYGAVRKVLLVR